MRPYPIAGDEGTGCSAADLMNEDGPFTDYVDKKRRVIYVRCGNPFCFCADDDDFEIRVAEEEKPVAYVSRKSRADSDE